MALETICAVVPTIAEHTFVPITRHLGYAFNYKSKVEKLKTQVQKLTAQRDGLQQRIDEARRQGNEINVDVKTWLSCVEKAIEQAKEVVDSEEQERGRCLLGLIPNLKKQYQLGKRAEVEMRPLEQLGNSNFDRISHRPPLQQIVAPSVYGTEGLNSRVFMSEKVIEALMDPAVNMVGVYGMGGVGKTTLAKEVHRQALQDKLFDVVVMAAVSETPDLTKIQGTIADMLGIKLEEETEYGRACRLRQRLMNEKNILIILDDIWEQLEPEAVGIPLTPSHNGCKLLLTSRRKDVLEQGMGAERTLEVRVLSEAEAWSLFETTVGGVIDQALYSVANEIAKKCAGLPLLVVTVARALKNKELHEWKVALDELSRIDNEGIQAKAYSALELSYNHLVGEVKSFFLLCGQLAQHDILVQDLVGYSMGLNLLKHKGTVEGARNRVHKLISDLKAACLLLDGDKSGFVKMHDVVRDAALAIGKSSQCIFTFRDASGLKEWPNKNLLRSCTRISLPYFEMDELPERLECPELELLLFGIEKNPHLRIPDSFFEMARKLRVLDFRGLLCLSLPRSLGFLSSLYTLCLHGCQLGDTAFIGELKSLEILSFRGSEVRQLPREIGQLTRLKLLDLSECYHLKVIPPNVISRLSMLEELYMGDCINIQWEVEGISNPSNASLAELRNLSLLKILEILVPDAKMLPEDLFRNYKLEKYNICIGAEALERKKISIGASWYYSLYETSRTLKLKLETNSHLELGIGAMLKEAEHLSLDVSEGFKSMFYDPDWEGFPKLKNLSLANCHDIQYIINFVNQVPFDTFPALESLSLLDLMNLEKFCHGQLPTGSFSKLRILEVYGCYRLKNLFSFSMVRNLPELQKMKVSDCPEMEEIIGGESGIKGDEVDEVAEFPELRCLRLSRLPLLVNFCSKLTSQTREEQLTLFNRRVLFPNLEELKVKAIGGEIRQDNEVSVVSSSCLKLKHLFLSSFVRSHERIKKLQISRCESIEGIVLTEEETMNNRLFVSLESLTLSDLPYLTRFCEGYLIEFCSLTKLSLSNCPALKTFISNPTSADVAINIERRALFDKKVEFPSLENLDIRRMDNLETTWDNQLGAGSFCKLKSLRIVNCEKLKNIFPSKDLGRFQRLEELRLQYCDSVEEVYQLQELNAEETSCVLAFDLRSLGVRGLTQLKYIWSKDPKGIFTFPNLRLVDVSECKVMKYVFPESIATDLTQLQSLSVRFFCGVEEIVGKAEGAETAPFFGFPQLLDLILEYLPEMKSFYAGIYTSEFPKLKNLTLIKMRQVESKFFIVQENDGDDEHVSIKKIFPKLEKLAIDGQMIEMILQHRWSTALFSKVKSLDLRRVHHKLAVDLCGFLARFPNLENCSVEDSSLKELFQYKGHGRDKKDVAIVLQRIRILDILRLPNLKHIWKQHPQLHLLLQHAETINVSRCDSLTNLAPSSASFQNLTTLQVSYCEGLLHLTTLSVAKSMEQLINMEIENCERLTEIVVDDGDGTTEEIVFPKLKTLNLDELESLTSFCLGSFTFNFPSLVEVTVKGCPNMRTFSAGGLITPKMLYVLLTEERFDWQGNLNATVQHMHQEMDGFDGIEIFHMELSKFPQLKEKWNSQASFKFLSSVETLVVEKCEFFTRALSSNHLQFLENLENLVVEQCDSLEEIFDLEGLAADEGYVSCLRELELSHLPQLKSIWSKSPRGILSLESLELLKIHNCSSLRNIFTLSTASPLVGLQYLEVKGCELLVKIINEEGEKEGEYWDKSIFPSLRAIILESLPSLVSFYSGIHILKCPTLEKIDVVNCPKMDIFPSNDESVMILEGNKEPREGPIFSGTVAIENFKKNEVGMGSPQGDMG